MHGAALAEMKAGGQSEVIQIARSDVVVFYHVAIVANEPGTV